MSIQIRPLTDRSLRVNNKVVYQDSNDNWVAVTELSTAEKEALNNYLLNNDGRSTEQ